MHETGHLLGLADRYEDVDLGGWGGQKSEAHKGFEKDLMGGGVSLDKIYYEQYIMIAKRANPNIKFINGKFEVSSRNDNGRLITPYEKGGLHKKSGYAK